MTAPGKPAVLPPELSALLTQLSVALHKCRAYPPAHPMRSEARDNILVLVGAALENRTALRIGVARRNLLIDDKTSDRSQPVLRELAERLHRRQVGAIVLRKGVTAADLEATLERLNADPRRTTGGTVASEPEHIGECVDLLPMSYTHLVMAGEGDAAGGPGSLDDLWAELARLSVASPDGGAGPGGGGATNVATRTMAEALVASQKDPSRRAALIETLERFGRAATREKGARGTSARRELRQLLEGIPPETLTSVLGIDLSRREGFDRLIEASEWLALPALVDLVESAAAASGQTISHFLLRLLRKLGRGAQGPSDPTSESDHDSREAIQGLLKNWNLADPNPDQHTRLLETLSRRDQGDAGPATTFLAEGERVVRMALEIDAEGPIVMESVDGMLESGQFALLLDLLEGAGADTAAPFWRHLTDPETLRRVLLEEPIDPGACARLLSRVGVESAEGLLDSLTISESHDTRRLILRRLSELGTGVAPLLVERLDAAPWYLRRNLLGLLADLPGLPPGFTPRRYADDDEPLLRLEALRLMMRSEQDREDALHRALADADDRVVRVGLESGAEHGLPRASLPRLMKLLNDPTRSSELRARGIGLLVQYDSPAVRQWLIERTLVRRGFFRRTRLALKSPDMVAGLGVLARAFSGHAQTAEIMRLARASGDPELISAVGARAP